jgi:phospholipid-transporting ATPase
MATVMISARQVQLEMGQHSNNITNDLGIRKSVLDLFEYKYENALPKGNYQKRFQTKNRKISSDRVDHQLPDNSIQTSKYTLINFLPKQLFE